MSRVQATVKRVLHNGAFAFAETASGLQIALRSTNEAGRRKFRVGHVITCECDFEPTNHMRNKKLRRAPQGVEIHIEGEAA